MTGGLSCAWTLALGVGSADFERMPNVSSSPMRGIFEICQAHFSGMAKCRSTIFSMGERMEWMDLLDKSSAYIEKRKSKGWILLSQPDRLDSVWEVRKWGSTRYILSQVNDWDGSISEQRIPKP